MEVKHVKKACPFCQNEVRSSELVHHLLTRCKKRFVEKYINTLRKFQGHIEIAIGSETLYANLGKKKGCFKHLFWAKLYSNIDASREHRDVCKKLVEEYDGVAKESTALTTDTLETITIKCPVPVAHDISKFQDISGAYCSVLYNLHTQMKVIEKQQRKQDFLLDMLKKRMPELYEDCEAELEETYEEESDDEEIIGISKKVSGILNLKLAYLSEFEKFVPKN
jgi:hypothetical protein